MAWEQVTPTEAGDWADLPPASYNELLPLSAETSDETAIFRLKSSGIVSGRDRWNFNFSRHNVAGNSETMVSFYNSEVARIARKRLTLPRTAKDRSDLVKQHVARDATQFSWTRNDYVRVANGETYSTVDDFLVPATYRPFTLQHVNFHPRLNSTLSKLPAIFPTRAAADAESDLAICIKGKGRKSAFGALMVKTPPSLHVFVDGTSVYPRRMHVDHTDEGAMFATSATEHAITDQAVQRFQETTGLEAITQDDIFF